MSRVIFSLVKEKEGWLTPRGWETGERETARLRFLRTSRVGHERPRRALSHYSVCVERVTSSSHAAVRSAHVTGIHPPHVHLPLHPRERNLTGSWCDGSFLRELRAQTARAGNQYCGKFLPQYSLWGTKGVQKESRSISHVQVNRARSWGMGEIRRAVG